MTTKTTAMYGIFILWPLLILMMFASQRIITIKINESNYVLYAITTVILIISGAVVLGTTPINSKFSIIGVLMLVFGMMVGLTTMAIGPTVAH